MASVLLHVPKGEVSIVREWGSEVGRTSESAVAPQLTLPCVCELPVAWRPHHTSVLPVVLAGVDEKMSALIDAPSFLPLQENTQQSEK